MATVDYSGALLKLERAEAHIADLDFLIFTYLRRQAYKIAQIVDLETGKAGFEITLKELPPAIMSGVLGDAIHNLRAALDITISAIALARGERIDRTYFPFAKFRDDIDGMIEKRASAAGDEAMQICRELCPYKGGNDALWALHQTDIIDKHQTLIVGAAVGDFRYGLLPQGPANKIYMDAFCHHLSLEPYFVPGIEGREFEHPFEIGLSVEIVLPASAPEGGKPVIAVLNEFRRVVSGVIQQFQARCPTA